MFTSDRLSPGDLHQLVLLYLAVAYEADEQFDPAERYTIVQLIGRWAPEIDDDEAHHIVKTALKALKSGMTGEAVTLARTVGAALSPEQRRHVLADLGQVARADGHLSVREARTIRDLRAALTNDA